jgi:hypothetical protein
VFIDICGDAPMPGPKSIDTRLRAIRNAIEQHPGFAFSKDQSTTSKGLKRADRFLYDERIPEELLSRVVYGGSESGGVQQDSVGEDFPFENKNDLVMAVESSPAAAGWLTERA